MVELLKFIPLTKLQTENRSERQRSNENNPRFNEFLGIIGRPDIGEKLNPKKPAVYWTAEMYASERNNDGEFTCKIKGGGGLGVLAGDTYITANKLGEPKVFVTNLYSDEAFQSIGPDMRQKTDTFRVNYTERGFKLLTRKDESANETIPDKVYISTIFDKEVPLDIYTKQNGSASIIGIHEPNLGELYQDENNSDHRLYQEVAFGFGGYKALKKLGVEPSQNQINEGSAVFGSLADLDHIYGTIIGNQSKENSFDQKEKCFKEALKIIRNKTIYTNHTLVQAAEASFSKDQFEKFVLPNIDNPEVSTWVMNMFSEDYIKLSTIAIELADKRNGVSLLHAQVASKQYYDASGNPVEFTGITNGISPERWGSPQLLNYYTNEGVMDKFGLPAANYQEKIDNLSGDKLREIKNTDRKILRAALKKMKDQNGNSIDIPEEAKIIGWARRFADYKRPEMILQDPDRLAIFLEEENIHLVISGKAHQKDQEMQNRLCEILCRINNHEKLREYVHYIPNYSEKVSAPLLKGADIWLNNPKVGFEADGTSKDKAMLNNAIIVSTNDGGMADPSILHARGEKVIPNQHPPYFLEITGQTHEEELNSIYTQIRIASKILNDQNNWTDTVKRQIKGYYPYTISDANMEERYLNLAFPKKISNQGDIFIKA